MSRRPLTAGEEWSARLAAERSAPFQATHVYNPIGWDALDPRWVQGEALQPGSPVQLLKEHTNYLHAGSGARRMFSVVRDEGGNTQHVSRDSLDRPGPDVFRDRRDKG